jgi:hypothetical protein
LSIADCQLPIKTPIAHFTLSALSIRVIEAMGNQKSEIGNRSCLNFLK